MSKLYQKIKQRLKQSKRLLILTHLDPDGDSIGSAIAFTEIAKIINPKIKIKTVVKNISKISIKQFVLKYNFIDCDDFVLNDYDLVVAVDTSAVSRLSLNISVNINIDHHHDNHKYGELNVIDGKAAAVGVILFKMIKYLKIKITKKMAEGLYLSIYTDTGHFSFANTNKDVFEVANACVAAGLVPHDLYKAVAEQASLNDIKELGKALSKVETYFDEKLIIGFIPANSDLDNRTLIDYIRQEKNSQVAVVMVVKKDFIKLSFRSKSNVDVSKIAAAFSGGGHKKAAAGKIDVRSMKRAKKTLLKYFQENVF